MNEQRKAAVAALMRRYSEENEGYSLLFVDSVRNIRWKLRCDDPSDRVYLHADFSCFMAYHGDAAYWFRRGILMKLSETEVCVRRLTPFSHRGRQFIRHCILENTRVYYSSALPLPEIAECSHRVIAPCGLHVRADNRGYFKLVEEGCEENKERKGKS